VVPLDRWAEERRAAEAAERLLRRPAERPLRRAQEALRRGRHYPPLHHGWIRPVAPGADVAFLTVANDRFFRGLEGLLLSLLEVYPDLRSPVHVLHDGSLVALLQHRLLAIYPRLLFRAPRPTWWQQQAGDSANQRRIGMLGYLNTEALQLPGLRRVIVLDADLLITGALDPLWAPGEAVRAVADCGETAYAAISPATGRPVINSGVLSLPAPLLSPASSQRMQELIRRSHEPFCPLLDSFADQKVWNQFLMDQPLEYLPVNFNCNVKYLTRFLDGCPEALSVLHFAGAKPWLEPPWQPAPANPCPGGPGAHDHPLWTRTYRRLLYHQRLALFAAHAREPIPGLSSGAALQLASDPRQLQGGAAGCSVHLLLADPGLLGERWAAQPQLPAAWLPALATLGQAGGVVIWSAFELEPALRLLALPPGVCCRYVLIEAPFSPALEQGIDLVSSDPDGYQPISADPLLAMLLAVIRRCSQALAAAGRGAWAAAEE